MSLFKKIFTELFCLIKGNKEIILFYFAVSGTSNCGSGSRKKLRIRRDPDSHHCWWINEGRLFLTSPRSSPPWWPPGRRPASGSCPPPHLNTNHISGSCSQKRFKETYPLLSFTNRTHLGS